MCIISSKGLSELQFILTIVHILDHRGVAHSVGDSINCSLDADIKIAKSCDFTLTESTI